MNDDNLKRCNLLYKAKIANKIELFDDGYYLMKEALQFKVN